MGLEFYLVAGFAVVITGISKSGFAGGLGVLAVPLMSLFTTPQAAAAVMMPILLAMDCAIIWRYRNNWSRPVVAAMLPGALLGLGLGAIGFGAIDPDWLKAAIGLMALAFVLQYLRARRSAPRPARPGIIFGLGALSGFASFVAHAGGPPVKGYLLAQNMDKSDFVGTNGVYFFILNLLKAVAYVGLGEMSLETLGISLALAPCLIVGVVVGFALHRLIDQALFTQLAYGLLAFSGLRLLADPFL